MADEEQDLIRGTLAHLPASDRLALGLSFENYEQKGYPKFVNRAMAQETDQPDPVPQNWVEQGAHDFARSPLNPDRARVEESERAELQRIAAQSPKAGGPVAAAGRAAVTRGMNGLASPVVGAAQALEWAGVPNKAAHMDAGEAVADAESLVRGETTPESRERALVTAAANPRATKVGEAVGDVAAGLATMGAGKLGGAVKAELPALYRNKTGAVGMGAGRDTIPSPPPVQPAPIEVPPLSLAEQTAHGPWWSMAKKTPPSLRDRKIYVAANQTPEQVRDGVEEIFGGKVNGLDPNDFERLTGNAETRAAELGLKREGIVSYNPRTAELKVTSQMRNPDGDIEGMIVRGYRRNDKGELVVDHSLFELEPSIKGKGLGKTMLRDMVSEYDQLGVNRIELSAAWDGKYVWPRMGFEPVEGAAAMPEIKNALRWYLRKHGVPGAEEIADSVQSLQDITKLKTKRPSGNFLRGTSEEPIKGPDGKPVELPVGGEDFLRHAAPDTAQHLTVDLNGASGAALRQYLGLPPRGVP